MASTSLKEGTGSELKKLCGPLVDSISETLSSLVGRELVVRPGDLALETGQGIVDGLQRPAAVARGAFGGELEGRRLLTLFELPDAVALAGLLMMTPEDAIAQRRTANRLEGEDAAAFGELGTVLYSGYANALQQALGAVELKMQDHAVVSPEEDATGMLGDGRLIVFDFRMKLGEFPESQGMLVVDVATAEQWNKGPLEGLDGVVTASDGAAGAAAPRGEDDALAEIPEAPLRGTLAAFVSQGDVFRVLRRSCRRVGLELRRHGRGEIPNPAAHRNEIVVLDVPAGEARRFDWCRRIKDLAPTTRVMLLLHHPSRQRVTQAFLARADAILGVPCEEPQLSQKLEQVLAGVTIAPPKSPDDEP